MMVLIYVGGGKSVAFIRLTESFASLRRGGTAEAGNKAPWAVDWKRIIILAINTG